ncbi:hypothetical protein GDO78_000930 [Eleutherodactylus coqui]|uniref:Uncharacterized protein n=1 Tax=Eleutherodactylus coqui TaxID=57060 RepID=A0A8J6KG66_ELECQ|nr:hypothetical protein GDO78_000930 [Eleutherodactylus coqui]
MPQSERGQDPQQCSQKYHLLIVVDTILRMDQFISFTLLRKLIGTSCCIGSELVSTIVQRSIHDPARCHQKEVVAKRFLLRWITAQDPLLKLHFPRWQKKPPKNTKASNGQILKHPGTPEILDLQNSQFRASTRYKHSL